MNDHDSSAGDAFATNDLTFAKPNAATSCAPRPLTPVQLFTSNERALRWEAWELERYQRIERMLLLIACLEEGDKGADRKIITRLSNATAQFVEDLHQEDPYIYSRIIYALLRNYPAHTLKEAANIPCLHQELHEGSARATYVNFALRHASGVQDGDIAEKVSFLAERYGTRTTQVSLHNALHAQPTTGACGIEERVKCALAHGSRIDEPLRGKEGGISPYDMAVSLRLGQSVLDLLKPPHLFQNFVATGTSLWEGLTRALTPLVPRPACPLEKPQTEKPKM